MTWNPFLLVYQLIQYIIAKLLSPTPPSPHTKLSRPRIAVIGGSFLPFHFPFQSNWPLAGLTGVSSAAHCVGHGFDVVIFEAGGRDQLGGIWARVNNTSGLQIHSLMYRFHPNVQWSNGYPTRQQIIDAIEDVWKTYHLEDKTKFGVRVERVWQESDEKWFVNSEEYGKFDGIIAAVGCVHK